MPFEILDPEFPMTREIALSLDMQYVRWPGALHPVGAEQISPREKIRRGVLRPSHLDSPRGRRREARGSKK